MNQRHSLHLAIDAASLGIVVAGGAMLMGWCSPLPSWRAASMPDVSVLVSPDGLRHAEIDYRALQDSCEAAGLPSPPDVNGIDAVPVRRLVAAMVEWEQKREPAALGRMGQIYLAMGFDGPALECFAAAAALEPESVLWTYLAGVCCQSLGQHHAAQALLERARDPNYPTSFARLATIALEEGSFDRAAQLFGTYVECEPDSVLGYNGMGQVALARGNASDATRWFERAVSVAPDDFRAWRLYGRALALTGDVDRSRLAAARAAALTQYEGWAAFDERLGQAHEVASTQASLEEAVRRSLGDPDPARVVAALEALRERRPHDIAAIGNLALAYQRAGRAGEALTMVREACARYPDSVLAHERIADVSILQRRFDEAHAATQAMIRLDPRTVRGHELQGRVQYALNMRDEGIASVARAIELAPDRDDLRLLLATLLLHAGRVAEAEPVVLDLLRRDASNQQAKEMLESIRAQRGKPTYGPG